MNTTGASLRPLRAGEMPALVAMQSASFAALATAYPPSLAPAYDAMLREAGYAAEVAESDVWVAEGEGGILGSAGWLRQEDGSGETGAGGLGRIRKVFVHPAAARQGLATRLVRAAEERARAAGCARFMLRAYLNAVPFYGTLGYVPDRPGERALPGGLSMPVLFMRKG